MPQSIRERLQAQYLNRKVLIIGFSFKTGLSAAVLFERLRISYSIYDQKPAHLVKDTLENHTTNYLRNIFTGEPKKNYLNNIDLILLSPGVPRTHPLVSWSKELQIEISVDVALIYPFLQDKITIGVTGTDGKSTTVSLLEQVLGQCRKVVTCGNNGRPIFSTIDQIEVSEIVIVELSSYMLEDNKNIFSTISLITNIEVDHLDRYDSFENYRLTKHNVFDGDKGIVIINADDEHINYNQDNGDKRTIFIGKKSDYSFNEKELITPHGKWLYTDLTSNQIHNPYNLLFVIVIGDVLDVPFHLIKRGINNFKGLPHRLEFVTRKNGITVYNDSKSTTLQSVKYALLRLDISILIMGGRSKGSNYDQLQFLSKKVKQLYTYGEDGKAIRDALGWQGGFNKDFAKTVKEAWETCEKGDTLLLSPGCTSWDQFSSFEERGEFFKKIIHAF